MCSVCCPFGLTRAQAAAGGLHVKAAVHPCSEITRNAFS